jgi:hypothetical protein
VLRQHPIVTSVERRLVFLWHSRRSVAAWTCSAAALLVFSGWLLFVTAGEVRLLARPVPPTPPEVKRDVIVRAVPDNQGRRASFRILLFSDEFRWRINSFDSLENGVRPQFTPEMKAVLSDAEEVIAVGASSEEIERGVSVASGRASEERRAARRAEQIAVWVRAALSTPTPVRKLNVGHHAPTERPGDTSEQRRVVIILVLDHEGGANVDEALRAAMTQESVRAPIFGTLLTKYSLGAGQAFTWVP